MLQKGAGLHLMQHCTQLDFHKQTVFDRRYYLTVAVVNKKLAVVVESNMIGCHWVRTLVVVVELKMVQSLVSQTGD